MTSLHRYKAKQIPKQTTGRADGRTRFHPIKLDCEEIPKPEIKPLLLLLSVVEHNCLHMTIFFSVVIYDSMEWVYGHVENEMDI